MCSGYFGGSLNGGTGTQQPLVFLLKMIMFGCFGGTTILGNTHWFRFGEGKQWRELGIIYLGFVGGWLFTFYQSKSPSNHHLGEDVVLFPSILCKSKIWMYIFPCFVWGAALRNHSLIPSTIHATVLAGRANWNSYLGEDARTGAENEQCQKNSVVSGV